MFKNLAIKKAQMELKKNGVAKNISEDIAISMKNSDNSIYLSKQPNGNYTIVTKDNFFGNW